MQAVDGGEIFVRDDTPRLSLGGFARFADVETPRVDASARAALGEDIDDQLKSVARQRPAERLAIAFAHDARG